MRRPVPLLLALLAGPALAEPPPGEPAEVRVALGSGAVVNWTRLVVEADDTRLGSGVAGRQEASEQLARQRIGPAIQDGLPAVQARSDQTIGELMESPELGETLRNRVKLWAVSEARYYASGKVALHGELDLGEYLRPWTLGVAAERPETPTVSAYTGLVVDARGTGVTPAFAPRLLAQDGDVLWEGYLWREAALASSPTVWLADAAHPAAARAGDNPLVVHARRARGSDLVLDDEGTRAVRRHLVGAPALGEGRVVILVDG